MLRHLGIHADAQAVPEHRRHGATQQAGSGLPPVRLLALGTSSYYTEVVGIKRGTIQQSRGSLVLRHLVTRQHLALVKAF
jgi:hypothetical protein